MRKFLSIVKSRLKAFISKMRYKFERIKCENFQNLNDCQKNSRLSRTIGCVFVFNSY
jgi:hypothetical protein